MNVAFRWLKPEYDPYQRLADPEARREWVASRFSVGDGRLLAALDPAAPEVGRCVLIVRRHPWEVLAVAVLIEDTRPTGSPPPDPPRFAVFRPVRDGLSPRTSAELCEAPFRLVESDRSWNELAAALPAETSVVSPDSWSVVDMTPMHGGPGSGPADRSQSPDPISDAAPRVAVGWRAATAADLPAALTVLASVKEAYIGYELDHRRVLAAPALTDVDEGPTAAFVTAFADARALEPEFPDRCPADRAVAFVGAVWQAERAWEIAERHAVQLGTAAFDPDQRNKIRRARQALELALEPDTPAGDRESALAAAHRLLDGLVRLPVPLEAKLVAAIAAAPDRPQLPAAD